MRRIGSQTRETLEESGYRLLERVDDETVILQVIGDPDQQEFWFRQDDHAGYTIEIDGVGYEYARDLLPDQKRLLAYQLSQQTRLSGSDAKGRKRGTER